MPMQRTTLLCLGVGLCLVACVDPDLKRGRAALGLGNYPDAIVALERARSRAPADTDVLEPLASAHRSIALADLTSGRCDAAANRIAAADALVPPLLADHQALLDCRHRHGGPQATRAAELERLLAAGDPRSSSLRELMRLDLDMGRQADALRHLEALEKRLALTTEDRRELAQVFLSKNDRPNALKQLWRVKQDDPADPLVRLKLAELLELEGKPAEAEKLYRALTIDYRSNPLVFLRLSEFYRRQGNESEAMRALDTANRLRGIQPEVRPMRELRKSRN